MGDRMFASEGDSVNVGRQVSPTWESRWGRSRPSPGGDAGSDETVAGVARRLQGRVDRHRWLLERMQSDPLLPEPAGLAELLDTVRRMRRDTESLLMLHGQEPGARAGGARRVPEVLADAVQTSEEPRRVDVGIAPEATLTPVAATELTHVLAELLDHVTAVYPGARVEVSGAIEDRGGLAVEVRAVGAGRHDPDGLGGRRALGAAERLAQRSRSGIAVRTPPPGPVAGPVASIHCPGAVVTVPEPAWAPLPWEGERTPPLPERPALLPERFVPPVDEPYRSPLAERFVPPVDEPYRSPLADPFRSPLAPAPLAPSALDAPLSDLPALDFTDHEPLRFEPSFTADPPRPVNGNGSRYPLSSGSGVDELFGPMLDLALEPADDGNSTPIFEAIASAWFREDEAGAGNGAAAPRNGTARNGHASNGSVPVGGLSNGGTSNGGAHRGAAHGAGVRSGGAHRDDAPAPRNWETPSDNEWRAAAERAARPEPESQTAVGLPRRRPGNQLVPPPRAGAGVPEPEQAERVPDRVRQRLSTYQRGLRQGRHRAEPNRPDPGDPAAW